MTRDNAAEATVKAMIRQQNLAEDNWKDYTGRNLQPKDLVAALEALGLFEPTTE